jgi:serine/threonine protein kinase
MSDNRDLKTILSTGYQNQDSVNQPVYSVPAQDLLAEPLLLPAPRMEFNGRLVPSLGGIPLVAKLGQGGMAAVYYGIHARLMLEVAVKVLPIHMAHDDPSLIQRFVREAQIAATVKSTNLVSVLDVNEEKGIHYLVMEFVNGINAGAYCRERISKAGVSGLDEATVLDICIAAAEGLAAAHAAGIVHRDIKPDNIMIPRSKDGQSLLFNAAKLADLGLARKDQSMRSLTGAQNVMGTPGYMAPEQANDSKNASQPADVFSLGATAYSLLCGQPPFVGNTTLEAVLATIQNPHRPIGQLRPEISIETASVIDRCLHKKPDRRCQDGAALLKAFQQCRNNLGKSTGMPVAAGPTKVIPIEKAEPRKAPLQPAPVMRGAPKTPARSSSGSKSLLLLLGLVVLAAGLWLIVIRNNEVEKKRIEDEAAARAENERLENERREVEARKQAMDAQQKEAERRAAEARAVVAAMAAKKKQELEAQQPKPKPSAVETTPLVNTNDATSKNAEIVIPLPRKAESNDALENEARDRIDRINRLAASVKAAQEDAQKASNEQTRCAELAQKANEKRKQASDLLQKAQADLKTSRTVANKAAESARLSPHNTAMADQAEARKRDLDDAEDAAAKADRNFQDADKQFVATEAAYQAAAANSERKLANMNSAQKAYTTAVDDNNKWINEQKAKH